MSLLHDKRLKAVQWKDLTALSAKEVFIENTVSLPWLVLSLFFAYKHWYIAALPCSFLFFLTGLRQVHNAFHYTLGTGKAATEVTIVVNSILMMTAMHAVKYNHMRHHKYCLQDADVEGHCAKMTALQALLYGPMYIYRQHSEALQKGSRQTIQFVMGEIVLCVGFALAVFALRIGFLQYHVIVMCIGECCTAFLLCGLCTMAVMKKYLPVPLAAGGRTGLPTICSITLSITFFPKCLLLNCPSYQNGLKKKCPICRQKKCFDGRFLFNYLKLVTIIMKRKLSRWLLVIGVPVLFALVMRIGFGIEAFNDFVQVMSVTFFFCLPVGVGVLTIVFSQAEQVKKRAYRIFMPWVPIMIFFFLTLALFIEGWACWVMALPVFLILSSVGGSIGGYIKLRSKQNSGKLNVSFAFLLPVVMFLVEDAVKLTPKHYQAYTYIDVKASPQTIWNHVLRVQQISEQEDKGTLTNFLSFPRPLKAELNYAGVGGSRQAVFTRGLVFKEVVTKYTHEKQMQFTINANTYEIPSATLDKHLLIGGDYFNVLDGTYVLERLNNNTCRLHLYSHFTVNTSFNFYAGMWATWIMKDIQNNILQVIQHRCEAGR